MNLGKKKQALLIIIPTLQLLHEARLSRGTPACYKAQCCVHAYLITSHSAEHLSGNLMSSFDNSFLKM